MLLLTDGLKLASLATEALHTALTRYVKPVLQRLEQQGTNTETAHFHPLPTTLQQSRGNTEITSIHLVFHKNAIYKINSLLIGQQCLSHNLSKELLPTWAKSDRNYFYTRMTAQIQLLTVLPLREGE